MAHDRPRGRRSKAGRALLAQILTQSPQATASNVWLIMIGVGLVGLVTSSTVACWLVCGAGALGYVFQRLRKLPEPELELTVKPAAPCQGLILPLSPISRPGNVEPPQWSALLDRIHDGDGSAEDFSALLTTNLAMPLAAIEHHLETIKHCWLITTRSAADPEASIGSWPAAAILERWFVHRHPNHPLDCHHGSEYQIDLLDHSKLWSLVTNIFDTARRQFGYGPDDLVVDITPGAKPMTVALVLACLAPGRVMQYIDSERDRLTGEPIRGGTKTAWTLDIDAYIHPDSADA